jgi:chromate reductase
MTTNDERLEILGIAGSLRRDSYNRALLEATRELLPATISLRTFERLGDVPLYNQDVEDRGDPGIVLELKAKIARADGLLIATPEYNYSVPGVLKNAIDWTSRPRGRTPLMGKPTALMGASSSITGTARAQLALRDSLVFTQTPVFPGPEVLVANAPERFDDAGRLTDVSTREFIRDFLGRFAAFVRALRAQREPDSSRVQPLRIIRAGR